MSKAIMQRLTKGEDLLHELKRVCKENDITRGSVQVIGAVTQACLGYYHQDKREYESFNFDQHLEILCGTGNVSFLDDDLFIHMHLTLSDDTCQTIGGHAMEGNLIFAAEAIVTEIPGNKLTRVFDEPTGLKLWG